MPHPPRKHLKRLSKHKHELLVEEEESATPSQRGKVIKGQAKADTNTE